MPKFTIRYIDERIDRESIYVYVTALRAPADDQVLHYVHLTTNPHHICTPELVTILSVNDCQIPLKYEVRTSFNTDNAIDAGRLVGFVVTEGITADDFSLERV